ncbi:hypothetical protein [Blastococcus sp. SYSU DS0617]
MGTYDTLHDGRRLEQLKLWGKALRHLHVGDAVGLPRGGLAPDGTYTVVMRTGGFVHVVDGVVDGWRDEPGAGPQLTTRGYRYRPEDWPGGPFGAWYLDSDAPRDRRLPAVEEDCPRAVRPALRVAGTAEDAQELARVAAMHEVAHLLAGGAGETDRLRAAAAFLAQGGGYRAVVCEAVARLLGVEEDPAVAGARLVRLATAATTDAELLNTVALVTRYATALPAPAVAACLGALAAALPSDEEPEEAPRPATHPAFRRRRARIGADDDVLRRVMRYGDLDFQGAAEAGAARHGAAALPAVPLRFWGRDVVVPELAVPLAESVAGRVLTHREADLLLDALLTVPGTLAELTPAVLAEALIRADAG